MVLWLILKESAPFSLTFLAMQLFDRLLRLGWFLLVTGVSFWVILHPRTPLFRTASSVSLDGDLSQSGSGCSIPDTLTVRLER